MTLNRKEVTLSPSIGEQRNLLESQDGLCPARKPHELPARQGWHDITSSEIEQARGGRLRVQDAGGLRLGL